MIKLWRLFLLKFWDLSGAKVWKSCRSRKSWKNEYLVAIVAVDTAENGPPKVWRNWMKYSVVSLLLKPTVSHFASHPGRILFSVLWNRFLSRGHCCSQVLARRLGQRRVSYGQPLQSIRPNRNPLMHLQAQLSRFSRLSTREFIETWMKSPSNFERLVLGCIDSYDSESRRIFQHFSRSTRFSFLRTAPNPKFHQKLAIFSSHFYRSFAKLYKILIKICKISMKFRRNFTKISENLLFFLEIPLCPAPILPLSGTAAVPPESGSGQCAVL